MATAPIKTYPVAVLMPPSSSGNLGRLRAGKGQEERVYLYFLRQSFIDSKTGATALPNRFTGTSMRSISSDWDAMQECARGFLTVLEEKTIETNGIFNVNLSYRIDPVTTVGNDRLSGVRLSFEASLFTGCELVTYTQEKINNIVLPQWGNTLI